MLPGGDVLHGPWDPAACSKVLGRWHAEGLVTLYVHNPSELPWQSRTTRSVVGGTTFYELSDEDSAKLLSEPARWQLESDEGFVCVAVSDSATDIQCSRWREIAVAALSDG